MPVKMYGRPIGLISTNGKGESTWDCKKQESHLVNLNVPGPSETAIKWELPCIACGDLIEMKLE